ncbi:MAG: DUF975 family protein [Oscillospiraceae bacterium]|nr:DUF975 family protein [Oscillospiraceae bacterium]
MPRAELKLNARGLMRKHSPKIFLIAVIFIIVTIVLEQIQIRLLSLHIAIDQFQTRIAIGEMPDFGMLFSSFRPSGVMLSLLLGLMVPMFDVGFTSVCLKISRGVDADYSNLFDGFVFFFKFILLTILIRIFIFLWALLLFFPAIPALYRYRQAYYILLDNPEKGVFQCIRESKQMMNGNKLDLFILDLSFIGWFLLASVVGFILSSAGLFAFPIVMIFLWPYLSLTRAGYYNKLINYSASE